MYEREYRPFEHSFRSLVSTRRIPELDGLRGLAILLVLIYHCAAFQTVRHSFGYYLLIPRSLMWSGVNLFFVLSGFLIGGILMDSKDSPSYYYTFYLRRIFRIFPLYYLMISLLVTGSLLFPWSFLIASRMPIWPFLFFLQNVGFGITRAAPLVGVTWSLAVEEQFYLLLPFAVRRLSIRTLSVLAIVCIIAAPVLRTIFFIWGLRWDEIQATLPCSADALAFGVLAAILVRHEPATLWIRRNSTVAYLYFALLVCGSAAMLKLQETRYTLTFGISLLDQMYFFLLVLLVLVPLRPMTWVFRLKWLGWLGTVSYCVYLIHQAVWYSIFRAAGYSEPLITDLFTFSLAMLAFFVVLSIAQLSWTYLENPLNQHARRLYNY